MQCRNTKVFIRILPNIKNCWEDIKILEDRKKLYIRSLQASPVNSYNEDTSIRYWNYDTDGVFYNESQIEIYQAVAGDIVERAILYGNNAVILAYGQTGTGKSLTISGLNVSYQDRGILPRLIADIFSQKEILKESFDINIEISYIETRRNYIKDLLVPNGPYLNHSTIKNVTRAKMLSEDEAMKLLFTGDGRRSVVTDNSHVSNAVFTLHISTKSKRIREKKLLSKIHVVDLMGADRYGYESCHFKSAFDVGTGNLTKSQLEQFFSVLTQNVPAKTPVFQHLNILIYYLRDTLSTENILRFVGHIRTDKTELIITLSMLRFAQIIRGVKSHKLYFHADINEDVIVEKLKEDLKLLKKELELNSMLNNENLRANITQERVENMEIVAEDYLCDKTNELLVLNVCDATTVMKVFKNLYNKLRIERDQFAGAADLLHRTQDDHTTMKPAAAKRPTSIVPRTSTNKQTMGSRRGTASMKSFNSYDGGSIKKIAKTNNKKSTSTKEAPDQKRTDSGFLLAVGYGAATETMPDHRTTTSTRLRKSSPTGNYGGSSGSGSTRRRASLIAPPSASVVTTSKLAVAQLQSADAAYVGGGNSNVAQLPEDLPTFNDAWVAFLTAGDSIHTGLCEELETYKGNVRDANRLYMAQARLLTDYRYTMDARQDDLMKARMQAELEHGIIDTGDIAPTQQQQQHQQRQHTPLEVKCEELLKHIKHQYLVQQEVVLKCQSELRLYIQQCNAINQDINDRFTTFCIDMYKTVVSPMLEPENTIEANLRARDDAERKPPYDIRKVETALKTKTDELLNKYQRFKKLRDGEFERQHTTSLKNRKWIRSCKAQ